MALLAETSPQRGAPRGSTTFLTSTPPAPLIAIIRRLVRRACGRRTGRYSVPPGPFGSLSFGQYSSFFTCGSGKPRSRSVASALRIMSGLPQM